MNHWIGHAMALAEGVTWREKLMRSSHFIEYIDRMEQKQREGKGSRVHSELGPGDYDLYIYEWMCRSRIMGEAVSDPEVTRQLQGLRQRLVFLVAKVLAKPELRQMVHNKDGRRMEFGCNTLLPLLACVQKADETFANVLELSRTVSAMLTASPKMGFDTAYVGREILESQVPNSKKDIYRYGLFQLILNHLSYVELSSPYWLPLPQPDPWCGVPQQTFTDQAGSHTKTLQYDFAREQEVLWEVLYSPWAQRHIKLVLLPMMLSTMIAVTQKDQHNSIASHLVGPTASPVATGNFGFGGEVGQGPDELGWLGQLLDQPHVRGVDFASPERGLYNDGVGADFLRERLRLVLEKGREHNKRMVFHIHGGEGFPVFDKASIFAQQSEYVPTVGPTGYSHTYYGMGEERLNQLCEEVRSKPMRELRSLPVCPGKGKEPYHYANARANMEALIGGIEALREEEEFRDLDKYVRIRIGHATHLTFPQALRRLA